RRGNTCVANACRNLKIESRRRAYFVSSCGRDLLAKQSSQFSRSGTLTKRRWVRWKGKHRINRRGRRARRGNRPTILLRHPGKHRSLSSALSAISAVPCGRDLLAKQSLQFQSYDFAAASKAP